MCDELPNTNTNNFTFSKKNGTISVGGDYVLSEDSKRLFEDKIIQTLCQVG